MSYITNELRKVGVTANTPKEAIEQAMQIGLGNAIRVTINICCTAIAWSIKMNHLENSSEYYVPLQRQAIAAFLDTPLVKKAKFRLKQIMHEAI